MQKLWVCISLEHMGQNKHFFNYKKMLLHHMKVPFVCDFCHLEHRTTWQTVCVLASLQNLVIFLWFFFFLHDWKKKTPKKIKPVNPNYISKGKRHSNHCEALWHRWQFLPGRRTKKRKKRKENLGWECLSEKRTNTWVLRYSAGCHFCIERLTACMSDFSLGKRAAAHQAAAESPFKE